jgi:hypothetical protein
VLGNDHGKIFVQQFSVDRFHKISRYVEDTGQQQVTGYGKKETNLCRPPPKEQCSYLDDSSI